MSPSQKLPPCLPLLPVLAPKRLSKQKVWESALKMLGNGVDCLNFIAIRRENQYDLRLKECYDDASSFFDGGCDIDRESEFPHEHSSSH